MKTDKEILTSISSDRPEAGELYIKTTHPEKGEQREVHGKGTAEHGTDKRGLFICCVGSPYWIRYTN